MTKPENLAVIFGLLAMGCAVFVLGYWDGELQMASWYNDRLVRYVIFHNADGSRMPPVPVNSRGEPMP
jgi:hypothetical protein